jgi:flagellar motor switch protein FliM
LETAVMRAPASLRAELGRLTLPLSEVLDLGVGGALTLPLSALEEVRLTALDGTEQAVGRLGQSRGMRAIRLTALPSTSPGTSSLGFADARPPSAAQDEVGAGPGAQAGLGAKAPVPAALNAASGSGR